MARGLNKVMIIGNLGHDPELRRTPSNRPVASFSVATDRNWTSAAGEKRSQTEWFNVVAWGNLAEICSQYLKKGQQVFIEGRLQTRTWQDEQGNKSSTVEVIASEMLMLAGGKGKNDEPEANEALETYPEGEDEFPF